MFLQTITLGFSSVHLNYYTMIVFIKEKSFISFENFSIVFFLYFITSLRGVTAPYRSLPSGSYYASFCTYIFQYLFLKEAKKWHLLVEPLGEQWQTPFDQILSQLNPLELCSVYFCWPGESQLGYYNGQMELEHPLSTLKDAVDKFKN